MAQKPIGYVTAQRALQILACFLNSDEQLSTQDLSDMIGFHKSAVSRLLRVMEYYHFLERDPLSKKYFLGKTIVELGKASTQHKSTNLVNIAKPFADKLRDKIGEDVPLIALSGNKVVVLYIAFCDRLFKVVYNIGDIVSPHVDAGAKAILAFSDDIVRDRIIKPRATFKRFTEKTITKRSELLKQFDTIRSEGVAYDFGELDIDVMGFAAPIFNHENKAIAALTIGGPTTRISHLIGTETVEMLKQSAEKISKRLFYTPQ